MAPEANGDLPRQWRSLEEAELGPRAASREFGPDADALDPLSRRGFLQLLGVSAATLGLSACYRRPSEKILPYSRPPQDVVPGRALRYATASSLHGFGVGLLVTAREGRPVKVEGNPDHPASLGATGPLHQAELLRLYDPQRARELRGPHGPQTWATVQLALGERMRALGARGGKGLRLLLEPNASPLLADLRGRIRERFPEARIDFFDPLGSDGLREGTALLFGRPLDARCEVRRADVLVLLDRDLVDVGPAALADARGFAARRVPEGPMSRVYVAEPSLSPTGSLADHRLRLRPSQLPELLAVIASRVGERLRGPLASLVLPAARTLSEPALRFARAAGDDLAAAAGRSLLLVGLDQPAEVHALALAVNAALGNVGKVLRLAAPVLEGATGPAGLGRLVEEMRRGEVETLLVTAFDPVATAPAELGFERALKQVPHRLYHALYEDRTAAAANWFVPAAHPLESWGDARAFDGTTSIVQPLLAPLFGGITEAELLGSLLGEGDRGAFTLLRESWRRRTQVDDASWERWLADGVIPETATPVEDASPDFARLAAALGKWKAPEAGTGLQLHFARSRQVLDGRFAPVGWLLELPEPITKLTWGNAALLSPATARSLALVEGDVVALRVGEREVEAPVLVLPGQADGCVTVHLGFGRTGSGAGIAAGVGFDAYALRTSAALAWAAGLELRKTGRTERLARTQEHFSLHGRNLAPVATLARLREQGDHFLEELRRPLPTLHAPVAYPGYRWGMAVDLARCTACNACVVACQAENNVPVVGREGVLRAREMHWLRVDRYFEGSPDEPTTVNEPMMCVHCETAPCEYVCPVNATVHSDEGLNEMVYNRCVGTRYCSNNCPYKVRRFNYLAYRKDPSATEKMAMNPEVTVRSRGVMEKCTYCVQRIERARIDSRVAGRPLRDGEVMTACQQACPTEAIVFGDLNDENSRVAKLHADPRHFFVLHELGTRPRTAHLARIVNPSDALGEP